MVCEFRLCSCDPAACPNLREMGLHSSQSEGFGITESQSHGMVWAGRDPKAHLTLTPTTTGQGHFPLEQLVQSSEISSQSNRAHDVVKGATETRQMCKFHNILYFLVCVCCAILGTSLPCRAEAEEFTPWPFPIFRHPSENKKRIIRRKNLNQAINKSI